MSGSGVGIVGLCSIATGLRGFLWSGGGFGSGRLLCPLKLILSSFIHFAVKESELVHSFVPT